MAAVTQTPPVASCQSVVYETAPGRTLARDSDKVSNQTNPELQPEAWWGRGRRLRLGHMDRDLFPRDRVRPVPRRDRILAAVGHGTPPEGGSLEARAVQATARGAAGGASESDRGPPDSGRRSRRRRLSCEAAWGFKFGVRAHAADPKPWPKGQKPAVGRYRDSDPELPVRL